MEKDFPKIVPDSPITVPAKSYDEIKLVSFSFVANEGRSSLHIVASPYSNSASEYGDKFGQYSLEDVVENMQNDKPLNEFMQALYAYANLKLKDMKF